MHGFHKFDIVQHGRFMRGQSILFKRAHSVNRLQRVKQGQPSENFFDQRMLFFFHFLPIVEIV